MYKYIYVALLSIVLLLTGCFGPTEIKTYSIYYGRTWENVNLHGREKNIQGFSEDLISEIGQRQEFKARFQMADTLRLLPLLDRKGVDAVISSVAPTRRNQEVYTFSEPVFTFGPVLILRHGEALASFEALKNKVIGFERQYGSNLEAQSDAGYIFRPYDQPLQAVEDLLVGKIDAVIVDSIYAHQLASGLYLNKIEVVSVLPNVVQFRLVVLKGKNEQLIERFNAGLKELKEESLYSKMLTYWSLSPS